MRKDIKDAIDRYANERCPVGDFLFAVLSNNLMASFGRADEDNRRDLFEICDYVYNHIPAACHGSRKTVKEWLAGRAEPV